MYLKPATSGALSFPRIALVTFLLGNIFASSTLFAQQVLSASSSPSMTTTTTTTTTTTELATKPMNLADDSTNIRLRNETAKWVPESVTILTTEDLNNTLVLRLEDLEGMAPGLIIDSLSGTPQGAAISIRGIGSSETSQNFEPAVALIIDGVYVGTHASQNPYMFDFEHVEISRGPQATYQGVSAIGGAINLTRSRPTGKKGLKTQLSFGTNNHAMFGLIGNIPLTDSISGKLSLNGSSGNRLAINNSNNGRDENSEDRLLISASVLWQASDSLEIQYTYDNESDDSDTPALLNLSNTGDLLCTNSAMNQNANCAILTNISTPETGNLDNTSQNFSNSRNYKGNYHTVRAELDYWNHHFTSITGLRMTEENSDQDLDATFVNFYSSSIRSDYDQFSQEFRVYSDYSDTFQYLLGAYFLNAEYVLNRNDFYILNQLDDANRISPTNPNQIRSAISNQSASTSSFFGHLYYTINEKWKADLGLRRTFVEKEINHQVSHPTSTSDILLAGTPNWKEFSHSAGLSYRVDDSAMFFFRYAHDFRPGGFNDNANSLSSAQPYGVQSVDNFELGLKSEWLDDKLRLDFTLFQNRYNDKLEKFARVADNARIETVIDNVSKYEVRGYEIEFETKPFENLYIRGNYSHMNGDYIEFAIPDISAPGDIIDFSDTAPNRAPADMLFVSSRYSFPYFNGQVNLSAGYRYTNDYQTNPYIPESRVDNATNWDFAAEYVWHDWRFKLFSQNFNDKRYLQNVRRISDSEIVSLAPTRDSQGIVTTAQYNQPRLTGIEITYSPTFK